MNFGGWGVLQGTFMTFLIILVNLLGQLMQVSVSSTFTLANELSLTCTCHSVCHSTYVYCHAQFARWCAKFAFWHAQFVFRRVHQQVKFASWRTWWVAHRHALFAIGCLQMILLRLSAKLSHVLGKVCFAISGLFVDVAVVSGNHRLGPSGSVVILHETRCRRQRLLNGPCGRNFGIICADKGLHSKSKGRGMVFGMLLLGGFLVGRVPLGPDLISQSFLLVPTHTLHFIMKVKNSAFCLGGTLFSGTWLIARGQVW